jgi:hypothetical protein
MKETESSELSEVYLLYIAICIQMGIYKNGKDGE